MSPSRDAFVQKMKAKLDEWNAQIDKLEAQSRRKSAEVQADYQQRIDDLKDKRQEARQKIDKLQDAGESAWEDLKSGVELAAGALGADALSINIFQQSSSEKHGSDPDTRAHALLLCGVLPLGALTPLQQESGVG